MVWCVRHSACSVNSAANSIFEYGSFILECVRGDDAEMLVVLDIGLRTGGDIMHIGTGIFPCSPWLGDCCS